MTTRYRGNDEFGRRRAIETFIHTTKLHNRKRNTPARRDVWIAVKVCDKSTEENRELVRNITYAPIIIVVVASRPHCVRVYTIEGRRRLRSVQLKRRLPEIALHTSPCVFFRHPTDSRLGTAVVVCRWDLAASRKSLRNNDNTDPAADERRRGEKIYPIDRKRKSKTIKTFRPHTVYAVA